MGRKRLLTLLAAMVAALGLQAAPASALDLKVPGVGEVSLDLSEDGLKAGVDLDVSVGDLELDPKVEVGVDTRGPSLEVSDGVRVGDQKVDLGEATKPVQDAVGSVRDAVPSPSAPAPETPTEGGDGRTGGDTGGKDDPAPREDAGDDGAATDDSDTDVVAAGRTEPLTPERERQLAALRAIRDQDAALAADRTDGALLPGVQLAPRRDAGASALDLAAPEVAPGVDVDGPRIADTQRTTLAASPISRVLPDVPVALQLLAGALVAGTALAWHTVRKDQLAVARRAGTR